MSVILHCVVDIHVPPMSSTILMYVAIFVNSLLIISSFLYYRIASSILKASYKSLVGVQHFAEHSSRFLKKISEYRE